MANGLKHSILILFTGLLLFNTGGSLVFFKLREAAIERAFTQALHNNKLDPSHYITEFTAVELINAEWDNSHEVKVNGRWYDVIATQNINGSVVYTCFADDDETALFCWYKEQQQQDAEDGEEDDFSVEGDSYLYKPQKLVYICAFLQTINTHYAGLNSQLAGIPKFPPPKG